MATGGIGLRTPTGMASRTSPRADADSSSSGALAQPTAPPIASPVRPPASRTTLMIAGLAAAPARRDSGLWWPWCGSPRVGRTRRRPWRRLTPEATPTATPATPNPTPAGDLTAATPTPAASPPPAAATPSPVATPSGVTIARVAARRDVRHAGRRAARVGAAPAAGVTPPPIATPPPPAGHSTPPSTWTPAVARRARSLSAT